MNTLTHWTFSGALHRPATTDGDCMAGPTPEYFEVQGTRKSDGRIVIGSGRTPEDADRSAREHAAKADDAFNEAAKLFCAEMGYPAESWPDHVQKLRKHSAMHDALHKVGRFYPH